MIIEYFPNFIRSFYVELSNEKTETLMELGEAFDVYLKEKCISKYESITDILPIQVLINSLNPLYEQTKGYHPALLLHFDSFTKSMVNSVANPTHYTANGIECIVDMYEIYGHLAVLNFCELNAYKYNYRQEHKGQERDDIVKSKWYASVSDQLKKGKNINEALSFIRIGVKNKENDIK